MAEDVVVQWTKGDAGRSASADVTVFGDGRVRLGPRFGGGERRLSEGDLQALRRFLFDEQQLQEIEEDALKREVDAAAERRRQRDTPAAAFVPGPQMDAGTTMIRAKVGSATHQVSYVDLLGDAQTYPEVEGLQRLRRIELQLLELAQAAPDR